MTDSSSSSGIRALCLFSGGLDSQLAVCLLRDQGLAVEGLAFRSLFFDAGKAERAADRLVLPLAVEEFTPALLKLIERPRHGFGAGLNPCIDCHIAMARRAGELMRERGFRFVATGEVLNQRPMSQHRQALEQVALESGLGGLLLRPLSAQRLPETEPERLGWVDRSRLLDFHGRSRKPQMDLARRFGIAEYPQPAGGCLLTDPLYGRRLRELKAREGLTETGIRRLRLGRHFQAGAGRVIITDVASAREVKLPVARALPAIDQVVDITETDLKALVMAETDGRGADMVVDCSGSEAAVNSAFGLVRRSGRVVAIGEPATPSISVNWIDAIIQNIDLHFTFGSTNDAWRIALQLVADGRVQLKPLISHRIALADFEEGFKLMDDKKALKVMMFPHGEAAAR